MDYTKWGENIILSVIVLCKTMQSHYLMIDIVLWLCYICTLSSKNELYMQLDDENILSSCRVGYNENIAQRLALLVIWKSSSYL